MKKSKNVLDIVEDWRKTNIVCPETGKLLIRWNKQVYDYGEFSPEGHPEITYCWSAWGSEWWNEKTNEYYNCVDVPGTGKQALIPRKIEADKDVQPDRSVWRKIWDKIYWICYDKWVFQRKLKKFAGHLALPLVRPVFPELIAKEFVEVQPMSAPSGSIHYLDYKKGKKNASKRTNSTASRVRRRGKSRGRRSQ